MARLILHFGKQNGFAFQCGRTGDPVGFGQLTDDFGMGMLADLADQVLAVAIWHPVFWLNLFACINAILKGGFLGRHVITTFGTVAGRFHHLRIHQQGLL